MKRNEFNHLNHIKHIQNYDSICLLLVFIIFMDMGEDNKRNWDSWNIKMFGIIYVWKYKCCISLNSPVCFSKEFIKMFENIYIATFLSTRFLNVNASNNEFNDILFFFFFK